MGKLHYEPVPVTAQYAPWKKDAEFQEAYQIFKHHTLVEETRCWELWDLLGKSRIYCGDVVEVGVWRGGTGCLMAWRLQKLKADCKIYLCDTFSGVPKEKITDKDPVYRGGEHSDARLEDVTALVEKHRLTNVQIVPGVFPDSFKGSYSGKRIQFVHIDVDIYQSAKEATDCVLFWMERSGIIVYDDYGFRNCGGVTRYVDEMLKGRFVVVHNLNGHAILVL